MCSRLLSAMGGSRPARPHGQVLVLHVVVAAQVDVADVLAVDVAVHVAQLVVGILRGAALVPLECRLVATRVAVEQLSLWVPESCGLVVVKTS